MYIKELELEDEGSWALMIEESNVRAIKKYHGGMARLDINYYLSVGSGRYYKNYFDKENVCSNRERIKAFLLDDELFNQCVSNIYSILDQMKIVGEAYKEKALVDKFELYSNTLLEYIAYYNSVITDTFYQDIYKMVDSVLPDDLYFALNQIKDALFATNNIELLTHMQTVDMLKLSDKYLAGQLKDEDIAFYVAKYKSTTASSGNPNGVSKEEVKKHLAQQTKSNLELEKVFLENLHFRYNNADKWSEMTAEILGLNDDIMKLVRRTSTLSYLKILMREEFQNFKITTRENFLYQLIDDIGKSQFDFMRIDEIHDFICHGSRVSESELDKRRKLTVFEVKDDCINFIDKMPSYVRVEDEQRHNELTGDVLTGTGIRKYKVKKIEQDEAGLTDFNNYIETTENKEAVAIITNVLRPFLVPKLKKFGVLITQYGGYTSHASVLCRELGINSMISVSGAMNALQTGDYIEVDFNSGKIIKVDAAQQTSADKDKITIDLSKEKQCTNGEVGNKAANLMKISNKANIVQGFVVTDYALENIADPHIQKHILEKISLMNCKAVVIRSSHESEDSCNGSCAGLFESFVNVDVNDSAQIIELITSVYDSRKTQSLDGYQNINQGKMFVIVQEMISADISGVTLSSMPHSGYDYMLTEYTVGDLCYLMQGEITPLITYIKKVDIIDKKEKYCAYPSVMTEPLSRLMYSLAQIIIELEKLYSHRVEVEWGIKDNVIYVFQSRPY